MVGCSSEQSEETNVGQKGIVKLGFSVDEPGLSMQNIGEEINLSHYKVIVKQDGEKVTEKTFAIDQNQVSFKLEPGQYQIMAQAIEEVGDNQYVAYKGESALQVKAEEVNDKTILLKLNTATVEVNVNIAGGWRPDEADISQVTISYPFRDESYAEDIDLSNGSASITKEGVSARKWDIGVKLGSDGLTKQGVYVLPDRVNTYNLTITAGNEGKINVELEDGPAQVTSLEANWNDAGKVDLSWGAVDNATFYMVYRSSEEDFSAAQRVKSLAGEKTSYSDSPNSAGTYYYWVESYNADGLAGKISDPIATTDENDDNDDDDTATLELDTADITATDDGQYQVSIKLKDNEAAQNIGEMHLVGTMNDWAPADKSYALTKGDDGVTWSGTFALEVGNEFKVIYDTDNWDDLQHFGTDGTSEGDNFVIEGNDDNDDNNDDDDNDDNNDPGVVELDAMEILPTDDGQWQISVQLKDNEAGQNVGEMHLVGTMNDWTPSDKSYALTKGNDGVTWSGTFALEAGAEFKVIYDTDTWDDLQHFGTDGTSEGDNFVIEGNDDNDDDSGDGTNVEAVEKVDGGWKFNFDPAAYGVTVENEVHLVGGMNAWDPADQTYTLTKQSDGTWTGTFSDIETGTEFKFIYDSTEWNNHDFGDGAGNNLVVE